MTVIIPLSGAGQRFIDTGYTDIKPLIKLNGKTILEYVIDMYSTEDDFVFIVNEEHVSTTNILSVIQQKIPSASIKIIPAHKLGPTYAVLQAADFINDTKPCIINYCDFYMHWSYTDFIKFVQETNCDGAVPCYTGFHPHLVHTHNVYAGCRIDSTKTLLEIKEKYSFTENKFEGHQSVGTYYFKTGALLKKYAALQIENNEQLNGEYYCSLLYPQMIKDGLTTKVYDAIPYFCQWGTPFDLKEFEYWEAILKNFTPKQEAFTDTTTLLLPMAGNGQRFVDRGYTITKPNLPVNGRKMYEVVLIFLPKAKNHIFVSKEKLDANALPINSTQITITETTQGQACTALLAKEAINNKDALLISPCDNGMLYNQASFIAATKEADVLVFGFTNYQAVSIHPQHYGWAELEADFTIKNISCKKPISNTPIKDYAITGAFWFKEGSMFVTAAEEMIAQKDTINNEYYIDVVINYCIKNKLTIKLFPIDYYICWGTPNDYETFLYWQAFHNLAV